MDFIFHTFNGGFIGIMYTQIVMSYDIFYRLINFAFIDQLFIYCLHVTNQTALPPLTSLSILIDFQLGLEVQSRAVMSGDVASPRS